MGKWGFECNSGIDRCVLIELIIKIDDAGSFVNCERELVDSKEIQRRKELRELTKNIKLEKMPRVILLIYRANGLFIASFVPKVRLNWYEKLFPIAFLGPFTQIVLSIFDFC